MSQGRASERASEGPSPAPAEPQESAESEPLPLSCVNHRNVETYLRCGKCGQPICARCVVITPVGARCRACANPRPLPTFEVTPTYLVRAAGAGLAAALVGGVLASYLRAVVPMVGWLLPLALGYAIGEAIARAVNRKRGRRLRVIAGTGVVLALVVANVTALVLRGPSLLATAGPAEILAASLLALLANPLGLLVLAIGGVVAASRL